VKIEERGNVLGRSKPVGGSHTKEVKAHREVMFLPLRKEQGGGKYGLNRIWGTNKGIAKIGDWS